MVVEQSLTQLLALPFFLFILFLCARAIFAFLETSITALRPFKIQELAHEQKQYKYLFHTLEKEPHRILIAILISSSFADVTSASLATYITETLFSYLNLSGSLGFSFGIAFATLAILIFGEILPKNIAKKRGESILPAGLWLVHIVYTLFGPLVSLLFRLSDSVLAKTKHDEEAEAHHPASTPAAEKEILFLIQHLALQKGVSREKISMLQNVFKLGNMLVKDIMIPATEIVSIDISQTVGTVHQLFIKHFFTRLPVYENTPDNIVGIIYLKDICAVTATQETRSVRQLIRPILFVPESMKAEYLLQEFRQKNLHLALVLNEHGIITGLTTIEDILEEIVGDINDEHEEKKSNIFSLTPHQWLVAGSTPVQELALALQTTFKVENSTTVAGFLTEQLNHLPKKGERILYENFCLQVQQVSSKKVLQVLVFLNAKNEKEYLP